MFARYDASPVYFTMCTCLYFTKKIVQKFEAQDAEYYGEDKVKEFRKRVLDYESRYGLPLLPEALF